MTQIQIQQIQEQGERACRHALDRFDGCPYDCGTDEAYQWDLGWRQAAADSELAQCDGAYRAQVEQDYFDGVAGGARL